MMFQHCPPEIISHIFAFACVDDGTTYRALSRLSKYSRSLVESYKYQCLALYSPEQIHDMANQLAELPRHRRRVKHLFVSDTPSESTLLGSSGVKVPSFDLGKTEIMYIISIASQSLESLVFNASSSLFSSTTLIAQIFSTPLPNLVDLTIVGLYPYPHRSVSSFPDKTTGSTMPRLERISLAGNRNPLGLLQAGNLDEACPSLRELRICDLTQAISFAMELDNAISCQARARRNMIYQGQVQSEKCPWPSRLPLLLERIEIHTSHGVEMAMTGTAGMKNLEMKKKLWEIESRNDMEGLEVRVVDTPVEKMASMDLMRRQWMNRLRTV